VFLGNLPTWVTADDIKQWLTAEDLVSDSVKVIRNHETQESKGFAFVEAPTSDEMQAIIRRFDRAPLEDKILRANPAQPTKGAVAAKGAAPAAGAPRPDAQRQRTERRPAGGSASRRRENEPKSAFATELAKAL
jgi:RNA recognition motif-containing protein